MCDGFGVYICAVAEEERREEEKLRRQREELARREQLELERERGGDHKGSAFGSPVHATSPKREAEDWAGAAHDKHNADRYNPKRPDQPSGPPQDNARPRSAGRRIFQEDERRIDDADSVRHGIDRHRPARERDYDRASAASRVSGDGFRGGSSGPLRPSYDVRDSYDGVNGRVELGLDSHMHRLREEQARLRSQVDEQQFAMHQLRRRMEEAAFERDSLLQRYGGPAPGPVAPVAPMAPPHAPVYGYPPAGVGVPLGADMYSPGPMYPPSHAHGAGVPPYAHPGYPAVYGAPDPRAVGSDPYYGAAGYSSGPEHHRPPTPPYRRGPIPNAPSLQSAQHGGPLPSQSRQVRQSTTPPSRMDMRQSIDDLAMVGVARPLTAAVPSGDEFSDQLRRSMNNSGSADQSHGQTLKYVRLDSVAATARTSARRVDGQSHWGLMVLIAVVLTILLCLWLLCAQGCQHICRVRYAVSATPTASCGTPSTGQHISTGRSCGPPHT